MEYYKSQLSWRNNLETTKSKNQYNSTTKSQNCHYNTDLHFVENLFKILPQNLWEVEKYEQTCTRTKSKSTKLVKRPYLLIKKNTFLYIPTIFSVIKSPLTISQTSIHLCKLHKALSSQTIMHFCVPTYGCTRKL